MGRDTVPGFAARLRALREEKSLSIDELAGVSGIHRDSIAKLEREDRAPSLRIAFDLADALEVTVDEMRDPTATTPTPRHRGRPPMVEEAKTKKAKKPTGKTG